MSQEASVNKSNAECSKPIKEKVENYDFLAKFSYFSAVFINTPTKSKNSAPLPYGPEATPTA